ncbi:phosphoglucomutase [Enterococcus sp. JM4C]|uniref:phosphomannomutase/phosphoglucomutase n=1 Tax=Candidatus Enterococcus huntleyi TaxID=1857217 RepID=UPI00137AF6BA|nr:phosphomannomutase/phosphoglucomutase [Enterococcus sp. JM4C]KAF1295578.1 phosphoglucomutase [Enterococcus sp. JM4C]
MLKALQNGSDIRGIAIETAEHAATLTEKEVELIGKGLVNWLRSKGLEGVLTVGVGRDSRLSGPSLQQCLMASLVAEGVEVIDFGLATTPAMFMATQFEEFSCDAGIMLTASHLPYYFNGIKIFSQTGGAEKEDIHYILTHTDSQADKENERDSRGVVVKDILTPYAADLVAKIRQGMKTTSKKPLTGFKIIVDAGNGAGGFFAEKVLKALGADTTGSQFLEPDGHFPNHIPNPDNKEAMASIQSAVLTHQADLGVIFDTDVDRSAVVSKNGEVINRNNLIAVLSKITLQEHPGTSIVTNSPTSDHLKLFIEENGGKQVRYISGYRNVINKSIALNAEGIDSQLAIETSGHAAFKENYFLDDGAYVIAKILMLLPSLKENGQTLDRLIQELKQPKETREIRFHLLGDEYRQTGEKAIAELPEFLKDQAGFTVDPENEEGIRFKVSAPYGSGWFLLRMSLHEPLLVLQVENDEVGNNQQVIDRLSEFFNKYQEIEEKQA